jgi:hypothetical protein
METNSNGLVIYQGLLSILIIVLCLWKVVDIAIWVARLIFT